MNAQKLSAAILAIALASAASSPVLAAPPPPPAHESSDLPTDIDGIFMAEDLIDDLGGPLHRIDWL